MNFTSCTKNAKKDFWEIWDFNTDSFKFKYYRCIYLYILRKMVYNIGEI